MFQVVQAFSGMTRYLMRWAKMRICSIVSASPVTVADCFGEKKSKPNGGSCLPLPRARCSAFIQL